jgi:hypothetical protein|tara:strand:+ start:158 stop:352 length:195 start_codon:yes stop_codon:yes gene_type:complete
MSTQRRQPQGEPKGENQPPNQVWKVTTSSSTYFMLAADLEQAAWDALRLSKRRGEVLKNVYRYE